MRLGCLGRRRRRRRRRALAAAGDEDGRRFDPGVGGLTPTWACAAASGSGGGVGGR